MAMAASDDGLAERLARNERGLGVGVRRVDRRPGARRRRGRDRNAQVERWDGDSVLGRVVEHVPIHRDPILDEEVGPAALNLPLRHLQCGLA